MQLIHNNQMIKLILELRRRLPEDARNAIRLTNPNILDQLIRLHNTQSDVRVRDVISQIMALAGKEWEQQLSTTPCVNSSHHDDPTYPDPADNKLNTQADLIVH
jgi:hypothetical protein